MNLHCFKLHWFYSISFDKSNIGKISGPESKTTVSEFTKRKTKFLCSVHLLHKAGATIRKFHVAVVQWQLRNVQRSVMHIQSYCFANLNLLLFCHSHCGRHHLCLTLLLSSKNFATMLTWHHTSPLYRGNQKKVKPSAISQEQNSWL